MLLLVVMMINGIGFDIYMQNPIRRNKKAKS